MDQRSVSSMSKRSEECMDIVKLTEELAEIEHERWSRWYKYQAFQNSEKNRERWGRQAITPYHDLAEDEKESDRIEARRTLARLIGLGVIELSEGGEVRCRK